MSKEFKQWAASYFSWGEKVDENDIESHELAWRACRNRVLEILKEHEETVDVEHFDTNYISTKAIEKIKAL